MYSLDAARAAEGFAALVVCAGAVGPVADEYAVVVDVRPPDLLEPSVGLAAVQPRWNREQEWQEPSADYSEIVAAAEVAEALAQMVIWLPEQG